MTFIAKDLKDLGRMLEIWAEDTSKRVIAARLQKDKQHHRGTMQAYKYLADLIKSGELVIQTEPVNEHEKVTELRAAILERFSEYVSDAEDGHGDDYWTTYSGPSLVHDFGLYLQVLEEK